MTADLLDDGGPGRAPRVAALGGALLVAVVAGGAAVRSSLPPPPLAVTLDSVVGSALAGDSFLRLHVELEGQGVEAVDTTRLTVAGVTATGLHPDAFDGDDRLVVQVDVTPTCTGPLDPGRLEVSLRDAAGDDRTVRLAVPTEGTVERLVRYRCRTAG